jgi:peptidyl-prolyl cis-trans isomerase D
MLDKFRKQAAKIFMSFLFGMLILSFAIWGVGDIFRGTSRTTSVATVGDSEISASVFSQYLTRDLNRLRTQFGGQLDADQIRALGIVERLLHDLIAGTLLDEEANNLGMISTPEQIKQRIAAQPMFQNDAGNFDRAKFNQALQFSNLSEQAYVIGVGRDLKREELGEAASGAVSVSRRFVEDFYRYRDEHRIADTITVPQGDGADLEPPDDAALQEVLTSHAERFQKPEYRSLVLIQLRAEDVLDEVHVSDEELEREFATRRDEFAKPERRSFEQVLFDSESDAESFETAISGGQDFDAAAKDLGVEPVTLTELSRADLSAQMADLAEAAFALKIGEVSKPIKSPFGWHVLRLTEIQPPYEPTLEDERETLTKELAQRHAVESLVSIANQLDDEIGGGATLEEAADKLGLTLRHIDDLDNTGTTASGEHPDLPKSDEFLRDVFTAQPGEASLLSETPDGDYFVFRVDKVTPPALPPLDDVRADVLDLWRHEEARQKALVEAEAIADRLRLGTDMAEVASEDNLELGRTPALDRFGKGSEEPAAPDLTAKLFSLGPDEVAVAEVPDGWVVLKLAEVEPGDPQANSQAVDILADGLTQAMRNDMLTGFTQELERNLGVTINQKAVDTIMSAY